MEGRGMKKVIFGSACMISGMLLGLLVQSGGLGPRHHGLSGLLALLPVVFVAAGLALGVLGLREKP